MSSPHQLQDSVSRSATNRKRSASRGHLQRLSFVFVRGVGNPRRRLSCRGCRKTGERAGRQRLKAEPARMLDPMDEAADLVHWEKSEEGAELVREGELEAAVSNLTAVIAEHPDNHYAHFFLGSAYFEAGDPLRALKA